LHEFQYAAHRDRGEEGKDEESPGIALPMCTPVIEPDDQSEGAIHHHVRPFVGQWNILCQLNIRHWKKGEKDDNQNQKKREWVSA